MNWIGWLVLAVAMATTLLIAAFLVARWLQEREPYRSVMKLRTRAKLRLFNAMLTDRRVPKLVRVLPLLLALYLAMPFDLVPDFIPVLGYMDDVAVVVLTLALMVRLTPREIVEEHVARLQAESATAAEPDEDDDDD
ncbi:MAG: YkvA family protein [Chloroflexi bacterium]|nr:YkvA family protein [Chloroflexota bacterium]